MIPPSRNLPYELHNGVYVLSPRRDLVNGPLTQELGILVGEIASEVTHPRVVVDLGYISWASIRGLDTLVSAQAYLRGQEGNLVLARTTKRISNVFLITKLAFAFDTYETIEEALVALCRQPEPVGE
jgi:anti-anti-sigma factor